MNTLRRTFRITTRTGLICTALAFTGWLFGLPAWPLMAAFLLMTASAVAGFTVDALDDYPAEIHKRTRQ